MSVVTDVLVNDNVNITHMLTGANADINIKYTVKSESGENIRNVNVNNKATQKAVNIKMNDDRSYTSSIIGGNFTLSYNATAPYVNGIVFYCIVCGVIIIIALLIILLLFRYNRKLKLRELVRKQLAENKEKCLKLKIIYMKQKRKFC